MAAATENMLHKIDSLVEENKDGAAKKGHRRASSMAADVYRIEDLGEYACRREPRVGRADNGAEKENKDIEISIETQKLGW